MKLTYRKTTDESGTTTVETPSVLRSLWQGVRFGFALLSFVAVLGALIGGDWSTAGWALVIALLWLPKQKRRAR